jgi:hypothetical protein
MSAELHAACPLHRAVLVTFKRDTPGTLLTLTVHRWHFRCQYLLFCVPMCGYVVTQSFLLGLLGSMLSCINQVTQSLACLRRYLRQAAASLLILSLTDGIPRSDVKCLVCVSKERRQTLSVSWERWLICTSEGLAHTQSCTTLSSHSFIHDKRLLKAQ